MSNKFDGKKILIFGGSGFIGKNLIIKLSKFRCSIVVATRKFKRHNELKFLGNTGQINVIRYAHLDDNTLDFLMRDVDIVVNLIGILYQNKKQTFKTIHSDIPELIARKCEKFEVSSFIHLSALGVEKSQESIYALSKVEGEKNIRKHFPQAIIIKPSVVFGSEDNFINLFINISKFSPILPVIGSPKIEFSKKKFLDIDFNEGAKFQPVYVGDLAEFILKVFFEKNVTYDVAGPNVLSFKQIMELILEIRKINRILLPVPFFFGKFIALFLEKLPSPILTTDQISLLKIDNISRTGYRNLSEKILHPKSLQIILPTYI